MITKEDIKKLLEGRKIIDGIQRIDTAVLEQRVADIKPDKLATLTKAEIIEKKESLDALYEAEAQSIEAAKQKLADLGFNSIGEFLDFNKQMCLDEYKDIVIIERYPCDTCKERPCITIYKEAASCYKTPYPDIPDGVYIYFLEARKRIARQQISLQDAWLCPDKCGYHWGGDKREPQFDVTWCI